MKVCLGFQVGVCGPKCKNKNTEECGLFPERRRHLEVSLNENDYTVVKTVRDHTDCKSHLANRKDVEKSLYEKGLLCPQGFVERLVDQGVLEVVKQPEGDCLRVCKSKHRLLIRMWVKQEGLYETAREAMNVGYKIAEKENVTTMEEWEHG